MEGEEHIEGMWTVSKKILEGVCQVSGTWPIQKRICLEHKKKSYPNFLRHKFFQTQIFWAPNFFFKPSIFGSKIFWIKNLLGIHFFDPICIAPNNLWAQYFVPKFFGPISLPRSRGACIYSVIKFCTILDPPSPPA